ncbi:MAG: hypothetical protein H0U49_08525 [Parachlamydiaceae bacterium]|nr:hypothetical protein [Parachlamydiaceae bacterium]
MKTSTSLLCSEKLVSFLQSILKKPNTYSQPNPKIFKTITNALSNLMKTFKGGIKNLFIYLPDTIKKGFSSVYIAIKNFEKKMFGIITSLALVPLSLSIGDSHGEGGEAFTSPTQPKTKVEPTLSKWKNWFRLSSYQFHLPGTLQEWQRKQMSTVIFKDPTKFCISPNPSN